MSENQYRVVFVGDLVDAHRVDVVKRNLATLFGTTAGNVDRLFGSRPVILKENLGHDDAIRFRDAIFRCGAFCRIETMASIPEVVVTLSENQSEESMVCTTCFREQSRSASCSFCGTKIQQGDLQSSAEAVGEDEVNRRYHERRQDLETSVNTADDEERRNGRDRRRAHLNSRR